MKIVRFNDLEFIPASHEDPKDSRVLKKVLFVKNELINGRVSMINWAFLPIGKTFRKHYHEDMDEVFIILNGKTEITIDAEKETLEKGDGVLAPMKKTHKMKNICDEDVNYIVVGITLDENGKTVVVENE